MRRPRFTRTPRHRRRLPPTRRHPLVRDTRGWAAFGTLRDRAGRGARDLGRLARGQVPLGLAHAITDTATTLVTGAAKQLPFAQPSGAIVRARLYS